MVLVLAGGSGEQLSVLTAERAVSAVPFGGKYRIIDFVLSNCGHSEMHPIGIITQHAPASLHDHIGAGRHWDLDRRASGVLILQPFQTRGEAGWYRGTADALTQNLDVIEDHRPKRILLLGGDHVYRMDYRALLASHERHGAAVTLGVARVAPDHARRFGMVRLDPDGRVLELQEKPEHAATPFASMGIYVIEFDVLRTALRGRPVDLVRDVLQPAIASGVPVYGHEFGGYWEDVGTIHSYYAANLELLSAEPRLVLHDPEWPILSRDEERPPVAIRDGAVVEDSLVSNGSTIAGTVRRSLISPGVRIEAGAVVEDSIVLSDTVIERGARVDSAILDKYVRVGPRAVVGEGEAPARDGRAVWLGNLALVGKDAAIPEGVRIGRASVIGAGASSDDFGGNLAAGTVLPSRGWFEDVT